MPKRVAVTNLQANTITILNTIRANASAEYQSLVPVVEQEIDIPKVGEVLFGYPAMANQFLSALMNRIALVRAKSATFNNPYVNLKKGYLEYGETVEEVFVELCKAWEFSAEKAEHREFKRNIPDVKSAFHIMNYRVMYPITIQDMDLRRAFRDSQGVNDLITKIIESVYVSANYDEFLMFKYLLIKGITGGKLEPVEVTTGATDEETLKTLAVELRGMSNSLEFITNTHNSAGVHVATLKENQHIFMDAKTNAKFDVDVLASAFNMDKADFMGHVHLIDDWTTFDNERFAVVVGNSTQVDPVTDAELTLMADVKAVLVDEEWFQVYDNLSMMTEKYVASGLYWNYFYHQWKTFSSSPFSNAVVFVSANSNIEQSAPSTLTVTSVVKGSDGSIILAFEPNSGADRTKFIQNEFCTRAGIAVTEYGVLIVPAEALEVAESATITVEYNGETIEADSVDLTTLEIGSTVSIE